MFRLCIVIPAILIIILILINVVFFLRLQRRRRVWIRTERSEESFESNYKFVFSIDVTLIICIIISIFFSPVNCGQKPMPQPDPQPNPQPAPLPAPQVSIIVLLRTGYENIYFIIVPFEDELIKGRKGKYYRVYIKDPIKQAQVNNPEKEATIFFPVGKYVISAFDESYGKSINEFSDFVVKKAIAENREYTIYVKGKADLLGQKTFSSMFDKRFKFSTIELLKFDPRTEQFLQEIDRIPINEPFFNDALPNLRGAFIQDRLNKVYELKSSILEGRVSTRVDEKDRNVSLILYIENN